MKITKDDLPMVVIDVTGNLKTINNSSKYIDHGLKYILIGLQKDEICYSHPEFHKREASSMTSRNVTKRRLFTFLAKKQQH
jgi:threonine dehydrogenase-like Zn-dependent dehydrogenase